MHTIDYLFSLQSKVRRATTPAETADALGELAFTEMRMGQSAEADAKLAQIAALMTHPSHAEIKALHTYLLGVFDFYNGRTASSVSNLLNAGRIARLAGSAKLEARALAAMCMTLTMMGAHADAFEAADQALEIGEAAGDDRAITTARISLAYLYIDRVDGDAALMQIDEAGAALARLRDPFTTSSVNACRVGALIVNARQLMREPTDENRKTVEKTIEICEGVAKAADETRHMKARVYSWGNLARLYQLLGDNDRALATINHTIALCEEENTADNLASVCHAKATYLMHLGRYPEAAELLDKARDNAMGADYLSVHEEVEAARVTCYEAMGDIARALEASKAHTRLLIMMRASERANLDTLRNARREFAAAQREISVAREHAEQMGKEQKRLIENTQKLTAISFEDALTQLKNRRYFDFRFPELIRNHARVKSALSMAIIDIDAFKMINDRFGHIVGDAVLQGVANALLAHKRVTDEVCRLGGDEFVLFLPDTHLADAYAICEDVRRRFSVSKDGNEYGATLSIGLAEWDGDEDHTAFLTRADQKLFVAKREGRNRVAT